MTKLTNSELSQLAEECGIGWAGGLGGMDDFLRNFASAVQDKCGASPATAGEPYGYVYTVQEAQEVGDERKVTRTVFTRTKPPCSATPLYTAPVEGGDTKRLDWMETGGDQLFNLGTTWYARAGYGQPHRKYKDLRSAIDAAMAAQKEKK